jgi:DinB superfamily
VNPYARHIGDGAPLDIMSATSRRLRELIETIGPERMDSPPGPGKWSARDIVAHLADSEIAIGFRLRQTLAEDHHVIQPFDQDRWATSYPASDARLAIEAFTALRAWNLALIRSVKPEDFSKPVTHPERGTMTFQTVVETVAGHDRNHLKQLEAIAAQAATAI